MNSSKILIFQIAALCHDLGHGPFSHVFEEHVLPEMNGTETKHEDMSAALFGEILKDNPQFFTEWGLKRRDQVFIESLIKGKQPLDVSQTGNGSL